MSAVYDVAQVAGAIPVIEGCRPDALPLDELLAAGRPALLKGVVREWGLVRAGLESPQAAMGCLRGHYNGKSVQYSHGGPEIAVEPAWGAGRCCRVFR